AAWVPGYARLSAETSRRHGGERTLHDRRSATGIVWWERGRVCRQSAHALRADAGGEFTRTAAGARRLVLRAVGGGGGIPANPRWRISEAGVSARHALA